jgi:hypothetical protein
LHRVFVALFQFQVAVFFITLEDTLALQKADNPVADSMYQLSQFLHGSMNMWKCTVILWSSFDDH